MLPEPLRGSIKRPLFAIRDMPARLGCWSRNKREITLSREIISGHRWDDVKEVLLHEMAHQVAHEGLQATSEPDHGDSFRQACTTAASQPGRLRHLPSPSRCACNPEEELNDRDRIVVRIHKLMALAESSNPNEAQAAMLKAHELISRHNVRPDRLEGLESGLPQHFFRGTPPQPFSGGLSPGPSAPGFLLRPGHVDPGLGAGKGRMGRVLEISGTRKNVTIAEYVSTTAICPLYRLGLGMIIDGIKA
jgi:hypothetical protein